MIADRCRTITPNATINRQATAKANKAKTEAGPSVQTLDITGACCMSIAAAVTSALEVYEFDEETGFHGLLPIFYNTLSTSKIPTTLHSVAEPSSKMSIAAAVTTALAQFEFDEETGFNRLWGTELPCLHCVLSAHRDGRLVCVVVDEPSRCTFCKRDHKKCIARRRLSGPLRTSSRNPNGVAPVVRAQELASNRELLTLCYRVQTAPEVHDTATIEENIRRSVHAYVRECREANVFVAVLRRLPTALETPVDGKDDRKRAKLPLAELPDQFVNDMERLIVEGKPAARNTVRTVGQGPVRRGAAQATPQKRRRQPEEREDTPPPGKGIRVSEAPEDPSLAVESSQPRRSGRKRRQADHSSISHYQRQGWMKA
ncbi:uncharacterized protein FSUBG_8459 [Fusarium subglutinans]|uniref:Uncharacterized protein n=1 Tax=Gibberella subglutinans TaxID=42677 RepID=A0A8H5PIU6_GIBSU|nr:uncharacterized protein FSUBG_8459 [Fusarium subglutinans]KAF5597627.1 hypothetical protein FSUBG_8459 [Fusarium subglutinans]